MCCTQCAEARVKAGKQQILRRASLSEICALPDDITLSLLLLFYFKVFLLFLSVCVCMFFVCLCVTMFYFTEFIFLCSDY